MHIILFLPAEVKIESYSENSLNGSFTFANLREDDGI